MNATSTLLVLLALSALALPAMSPSVANEDYEKIEGVWTGFLDGRTTVYQLEFDSNSSGLAARTGWRGDDPYVFAYRIVDLDFDGRDLRFSLDPIDEDATRLRVSGEVKGHELTLKIKRAGGLSPLKIFLFRARDLDSGRERIDQRLRDLR